LPGGRVYLTVTAEVPGWLEPFPDAALDGLPGTAPESVSLALVAALQYLPPRQRAVLILRDVLDFPATEVAGMLAETVGSVAVALRQARVTLARRLPAPREPAPPPRSARERKIAGQFAAAFERADVPAILALLTDDVWLSMPPLPLACQGRAATGAALFSRAFRAGRRYRLLATHANRQPAFGCYLADPRTPVLHGHGLLVLTLSGDRICALTRFADNALLPRFGFPPRITGLPAPRD
jgi:hypothetical protein